MKANVSEIQAVRWATVLAVIFFCPTGLAGQEAPPIIDMHLHAGTADEYGPPPLGLCIPMLSYAPEMQPGQSWEEAFIEAFENPTCPDPIWSPESDDALMRETIAALETHNVVGVLSGPPERVLRWTEMAPERFIPSLQFQLGRDEISADSMRQLFETGGFMVLGEVSNQYLYPREFFYSQLRMLVDAGFGKRVMFGSDQLNWPGVIERAIAIINEAPFLTHEQKRDILFNNAARFLRVSEEVVPRTGTE